MTKVLFISIFITSLLFGVEIPTEHAQKRNFSKSVELNAKVIQLSNAKNSIMSLVSGQIQKYYVQAGQKVKKGQRIALIKSIPLSKMTADYISLKKQFLATQENYEAAKSLYEKGMTSLRELNTQVIQKNAMSAQITTLESQLETLAIDIDSLDKASAYYILYAYSDGTVSALLQPLHSVHSAETAIVSIIKDQAFYIKSYLPLEYADVVKINQKIVINYNNRDIVTHITQVLPELDERTQRIVLLSSVDENVNNMYINSYVSSTLYFDDIKEHIAIKKTGLSFFNNEWVVFIPKEDEDHDEEKHDEHDGFEHENEEHEYAKHEELNHDEHEGHDHGEKELKHDDHEEKHDEHDEHEEEDAGHDEHGGHDGHDEEPGSAYEVRVIEIITEDEKYVAVHGLEIGEEYVCDKSYFVKSMILKSSLGGHGH